MCELLVDLPDVVVAGIDKAPGQPIRVHVETPIGRPGCPRCGVFARSKDRDIVELVDLPALLWTTPSPGVAQAALVVRRWRLHHEDLHRGGTPHRGSPHGHHRPGGTLGD